MDPNLLNRILIGRIKDLASRKPARSRTEHEDRAKIEREPLLKSLGLHPLPPRTDLKARVTGVVAREGYRIEKIAYESRPGLVVTAHLYLPDGASRIPVVLCPHGHWEYKKSEPVVQAQGIGLALQGVAAFIPDSPGFSWDDNEWNERRSMGPHDDWFLSMGVPVTGVYVWDVVRGLDYLESRPEIDAHRVGIAGASGGGLTAMYAFAIDDRIGCAAPICYATSLEDDPTNGCLCNHVPGVLALGDRSDVLAMRAPAPIMLIGATDDVEFSPEGHRRCYEKLKSIYRMFSAERNLRLVIVESPHDMNRRMREAALAFFSEHLQGSGSKSFLPEKRPLTDGASNPWPANTEDPKSEELRVLEPTERSSITFRDLLIKALEEPYPSPFDAAVRLVRWGKYGRLPAIHPLKSLKLVEFASQDPGVVSLPLGEIDQRSCIYLGLSVPEFLAQVLHLLLPGGPEGWETLASGGDVITSMIASMKTLVSGSTPVVLLEEVVAEGKGASAVATHLKCLRPTLSVTLSDAPEGSIETLQNGPAVLAMPLARYLDPP